jgi:hypothetical protein
VLEATKVARRRRRSENRIALKMLHNRIFLARKDQVFPTTQEEE